MIFKIQNNGSHKLSNIHKHKVYQFMVILQLSLYNNICFEIHVKIIQYYIAKRAGILCKRRATPPLNNLTGQKLAQDWFQTNGSHFTYELPCRVVEGLNHLKRSAERDETGTKFETNLTKKSNTTLRKA